MNILKFTLYSFFLVLLASCGGGNTPNTKLFDIELEGNKDKFKQNETVSVLIRNKKNKTINKVSYFIDEEELVAIDNKITLNSTTLGHKTLIAKVNYENTTIELSKKIKLLAPKGPEIYTYDIINEYPHDTGAYTQGLEFYNDTLYESTGQKGTSTLRKVNYKTGDVLKNISIENTYFGEGITILNNKIYQLTWQSKIGFIYNLHNLKKVNNFQYNKSKEGWGLCNNGKKIFKSDGTQKIWILNPETLIEESYIETATNTSIFNKANELEYVDGKIYANVYQKESIMIINATSGAIEGVINFGGLKQKIKKDKNWDNNNSVLNGVAYHPTRKTFFVTGKNWNKLFEVQIKKK